MVGFYFSEKTSFFVMGSEKNVYFMNREDTNEMGRVKRIWYLSPMRAAKVQASLRIRADPWPL